MKRNHDAVSAVIAVILMVALTVAIAASIYAYIAGFGLDEEFVTMSFIPSKGEKLLVVVGPNRERDWNDLAFEIDEIDLTINAGHDGEISAGQSIDIAELICAEGKTIETKTFHVTAVDTKSNQVLGVYTFNTPDCTSTPPPPPPENPYKDWSHRREITIYDSMIDADLEDFPILVHATTGINADQNDGSDILFVADDEETQLSHEIERYNALTGELIAWVKIPFLSSTENTTIYLYYGNKNCENQQDIEGTWHSSYHMVHHLHNDGTEEITDATSYNSDVTTIGGDPMYRQGKVGDGMQFDGVNEYLEIPDTGNSLDFLVANSYTWSAWVQGNKLGEEMGFLSKDSASVGKQYGGFNLLLLGPMTSDLDTLIASPDGTGSFKYSTVVETNINTKTWSYITIAYDGSDNWLVYKDGEYVDTVNFPVEDDTMCSYYIGAAVDPTQPVQTPDAFLQGMMDEVRLAFRQQTPEWISASFATMGTPNAFLHIGPEEPVEE